MKLFAILSLNVFHATKETHRSSDASGAQIKTRQRIAEFRRVILTFARPAAESRCIIVIASAIAPSRAAKVQSALKRDTNERRRCNRSSAWGRLAVIG